jgi:hypothetical protein
MNFSRYLALSLVATFALGATTVASAGQVPGRVSYGMTAPSLSPDASVAGAYCKSTGGVVQVRVPVYGTNNSNPKAQLVLAGSAPFCAYKMVTKSETTYIYLFLSTLYSTQPTLAALAYYAKVPESKTCQQSAGSPGSCYCSQLGGTDLFGGITAAGGAWVLKGDANPDLDDCIFPDLSSIDSFGLFYHSAGIIRGKNLATVLRYHKPR